MGKNISYNEERDFIRNWQENQDYKSRDELILANLGLVGSIANKYINVSSAMTFDDLFQVGTLGLIESIDKFDLSKDVRLSTFASWWIRHEITRALDEQSYLISIPAGKIDLMRTDPNSEQLKDVRYIMSGVDSLNREIGDDDSTTLEDFIENTNFSMDTNIFVEERKKVIQNLLQTLPLLESQILRLRFGLDTGTPLTLKDTAAALDYSEERVRQLEAKALRKLRNPQRQNILKDFYYM